MTWCLVLSGCAVTLQPGRPSAVAPDALSAAQLASGWRDGFDAAFAASSTGFEARWREMFTPGNGRFSGHLPALETQDAAVRSVYYHGALSAFALMRTSLPLAPVVFPTLGPQWAATISYFWDTEMLSWAYAMLEPQSLKATLRRWLEDRGHTFTSDTDTETLAHLVEELYDGNLEQAVIEALEHVEGTYGIGVMSSRDPGKIVAARKGVVALKVSTRKPDVYPDCRSVGVELASF